MLLGRPTGPAGNGKLTKGSLLMNSCCQKGGVLVVATLVLISIPGFTVTGPFTGEGEEGLMDVLTFVAAFAATSPDLRKDPAYLSRQIKLISDADLFAAMDLELDGLGEVKRAVQIQDYSAAYTAWGEYWASRSGFEYVNAGIPLYTVEEARKVYAGSLSYTAAADRVVAHDIAGWGSARIQHGPVVDFNAEYGDSGKYGFHYWHWSKPLLWAYLATGKTSYLDAFDELFNQWYEQRDSVVGAFASLDVIWYELGLGSARNRIFLDFYRLNRHRTSALTHERLLKNFLGSARWLLQAQKQGFRPGNGQSLGAYALSELGLNLPEFREAAEWVSVGLRLSQEHVDRAFYSDGCDSERCPASYMRLVYADPRNLAHLLINFGGYEAEANALRLPLERSLDLWTYLMSPLGTQPAVNDAGRSRFDARILVDGGQAFSRPDMRWVSRNLLGASIPDAGDPPDRTSVDFRPSGFAVMRQDWTRDSPYMVINYGEYSGGHSHADILSFELFAYGKALAVDAGIGTSYDDPLHTTWYRTSRAHNMLLFDDADLDRRAAVGEKPIWRHLEGLDYFSAEHRGYRSRGFRHRRHFLFVKPAAADSSVHPYFVVYDAYAATRSGRQVSFMVHSPVPMQREGRGLTSTESPGLLIGTPDTVNIDQGIGMAHLGGISNSARRPIGWASLDRESVGGDTPEDLPVLLYPFKTEMPPEVSVRRGAQSAPPGVIYLAVEHDGVTDHIVIGDGTYREFGEGRMGTDAWCAVVRADKTGERLHHSIADGRRLVYQGEAVAGEGSAVDSSEGADR
jgi:hypothetical protein